MIESVPLILLTVQPVNVDGAFLAEVTTLVNRNPAHTGQLDINSEDGRIGYARTVAEAIARPADEPSILQMLNGGVEEFNSTLRLMPRFKWADQLIADHPHLRAAVIEELMRLGEIMNVIAASKAKKSWLVLSLALSVATGRLWLQRFRTFQGKVLIIDNELHPETSAYRLPRVAAALGITLNEYAREIAVESLRGRLRDLFSMRGYFDRIEPGKFKIIVLDAMYRFMPKGSDENDNAGVTELYNFLDEQAERLQCSFVLVHHSSKGIQAEKSITDVGAGAGAYSRATDCHVVLRQHEQDDVVVMETAPRSWPPTSAMCLRWQSPIWVPDSACDPEALRRNNQRKEKASVDEKPERTDWDLDAFIAAFVTVKPKRKDVILDEAKRQKVSYRQSELFLSMAEEEKKIHRWQEHGKAPLKYSTEPPNLFPRLVDEVPPDASK